MAELYFRSRSKTNWTPASYTANETTALFNVAAGDLIGHGFVRNRQVFNGGGTDAIVVFGDGNATTRLGADGDVDETTTGLYQLLGLTSGAYYLRGAYLYTVADTIDIVFTANTSGTRTTGILDIWFWVAKADPH